MVNHKSNLAFGLRFIIWQGWRASAGEDEPDAREVIVDIFKNMTNNFNRVKIHLRIGDHRIMVHYIAQIALFTNGLMRYVLGDSVWAAGVFNNIMLMRVYHILPCNKTDQQYPRKDNMIFTPFQINKCFIYKFQQKYLIKVSKKCFCVTLLLNATKLF